MTKLIFGLLLFILFPWMESDAQFLLSGQFRPRTEFSRGYKALADEDQKMSVATTQRTRLNALFSMEGLQTKLVLQDVRYWGSQPQLVANEDYPASVHEAWAEVGIVSDLSLRLGRQELVYDDHRIFGNVDWVQQARSHDLVLLKFEKDVKLHVGLAHHENSNITDNLYNGHDAYKDLQFAWFSKTWDAAGLSLLVLNNGVPFFISVNEEETRYSQTFGGRFVLNGEAFSLAANLYGQTGKHLSGNDIRAFNFLIEGTLPPGLTAGFEYLSGNNYDEPDKIHAFVPLYGTNHKFNGHMDYFFVGNHMNSVGLQDAYLKFNHLVNKVSLYADLHYFASAGKISASAGKYLGTELDLGMNWSIHPMASLSAGWSMMFAGENMEILKGGNHNAGQHWGYIMLSVVPVFIR